jgi:hypothetical protein
MKEQITLREWIALWDAGAFLKSDFDTQVKAGWYDWFCGDYQLATRLARMANKVKQIAKSDKINQDTMYVFFKNNCPMWTDTLYDDFRICDIDPKSDKMYTIVPKYPKFVKEGKNMFQSVCKNISEVFSVEDNETVVSGTWNDVKAYFGVK